MNLWGLFCLSERKAGGSQGSVSLGGSLRLRQVHHVELLLRRCCGNGSPRPVTPCAGSALRMDLIFKISLLPSQCFNPKMGKKMVFVLSQSARVPC